MMFEEVVHWPFFTLPTFSPSPEKSYVLPSYAEALASTFASQRYFPQPQKSNSIDPGVSEFLDVSALEFDMDTSLTDSSGHSQSMSTSSQ